MIKTFLWSRLWPLLLLPPLGFLLWAQRTPEDAQTTPIVCASLVQGCSVEVDGHTISLGFQGGVPKPLHPFQLWLNAPELSRASPVEARFVMDGMDMGFNLYTLQPDAQGVWRSNVTLPVCVTGRHDWKMILHIDKTHLSIPFVTDL
jgi:hypothetical protein